MRKFLAALALLLGVVFLLTRFAELHEVAAVLRRGSIIYLALALLVEGVWIFNLSAFYQSVYRIFGMQETRTHMVKLVTAAYFVTVVAPSAGLSAIAVYITDAQRRGRSTAKVTVAAVLYVWFEYIGTLTIVMVGLAELSRRNNLHWSEITAALVLLAGGVVISLLLYLGLKSTDLQGRALAWAARMINRLLRPIIHRDYLQEARAYSFSAELAEGLTALRTNPHWIAWPLALALTNKALLLIVLKLCGLAFDVPLDTSTLICGLSIAQMFLIVSPTPAGIGVVEGILTIALSGLAVPLEDAAVVALSYRFFSFWVPLIVGFFTIRRLESQQTLELPVTAGQVKVQDAGD